MPRASAKSWQARWISDPAFAGLTPRPIFHKERGAGPEAPHPEALKHVHGFLRTELPGILPRRGERHVIELSAHDDYRLYLNGTWVGSGPAPAYPGALSYDRYDVTELLRDDVNVLAVHVYYQGLVNRARTSGDLRQGVILEWRSGPSDSPMASYAVRLATGRGPSVAGEVDRDWHYLRTRMYPPSIPYGYDTQFHDHVDAGLEPKGWRDPGYDDSAWDHPRVREGIAVPASCREIPPLAAYDVRPLAIRELGGGRFLADFGNLWTGYLRMSACGARGDVIRIYSGEECREGEAEASGGAVAVRCPTRADCDYEDHWILSGGRDDYDPYDYKALRYVEILDPGRAVDRASLRLRVRHYPVDPRRQATLRTRHRALQGIWRICTRGVLLGAQDGLLDCPSREKGQYLGDITVSGRAHMYVSGDTRLMKKALEDFARSRSICPGMMAVAPGSLMQEIADYSLQFPDQLLTYYLHTGDLTFTRRMFGHAKGILRYFARYRRDDGLLQGVDDKWNLVDWPEHRRDDYAAKLPRGGPNPCHNVLNAYYLGAVRTTQHLGRLLGTDDDPVLPDIGALMRAYHAAFYDPARRHYTDLPHGDHGSLHSQTLPLFQGLVPPRLVPDIVAAIDRRGMVGSVYHSYFMLKGLARAGARDLVLKWLLHDGDTGWRRMLREGADACFEAWGKEDKWNTSLCHPWGAAPIPLFIEDVLGLRPEAPGWRKVSFEPISGVKDLAIEAFACQTPQGRIRIKGRGDGTFDLKLPSGCERVPRGS